ncbi:MAG: ferritin family protein [Candidatus Scalindua sp.]|nr:ferritin family protein [Candidatus Scalindua sp.]MDV5165361.1 ferritin family protein [Candidatus Scalindua sp.]
MQKKKNVEGKEDITLSIVETAMAEELKASALYKKISAQLEDKAAKLKFDIMSEAEQKHYERLKKWYEDSFGGIPKDIKLKTFKAVKIERPEKEANYEDVIKRIIETEEKACKFYENAAKRTKDEGAKKLFETLIKMESAHVKQFKDEFRIITEPSLRFADEEIPWMLEV